MRRLVSATAIKREYKYVVRTRCMTCLTKVFSKIKRRGCLYRYPLQRLLINPGLKIILAGLTYLAGTGPKSSSAFCNSAAQFLGSWISALVGFFGPGPYLIQ